MKLLIALLFVPSILFAETIVGYEYYMQPIQKEAIADSKIMAGSIEEKERWTKLSRPIISPTMDNYAKDGKVKKVIIKQESQILPNGKPVIFTRKEGDVPSDYNYSTAEENKKKIEVEKNRLKAIRDTLLEEQAKKNLGL